MSFNAVVSVSSVGIHQYNACASSREDPATMACTGFRYPLRCLLREAQSMREVPSFLAPAVTQSVARRSFSTSQTRSSRIGMAPVSVPADVNLRFHGLPKSQARSRNVDAPTSVMGVTGPQGTKATVLHAKLSLTYFKVNCQSTCRRTFSSIMMKRTKK